MTKIRIEVCIISARGLGRSPTLLKPQWFAVAWIDPNSKYCTKINSSGNLNPTWKTMFSFNVDERSSNLQELSLNVEIHKREPIFLREKLHGTATIMLKEFLAKFSTEGDAFKPIIEETGSFQLRKQNSGRPQGFVDISLHISEDREDVHSYPGIGKTAVKPSAIVLIPLVRYVALLISGIFVVKAASRFGFLPEDPLFSYVLLTQFTLPLAVAIGYPEHKLVYKILLVEQQVIFIGSFRFA